MKALSKPLSSPSRPDKFPPPLMRFLRTNGASRSRGRSRSSPIFYLRSKKTNPAVIESTQEPSSPKVTCIGQVRVRRAAKSKVRKTAVKRRRCWWLKKSLLCGRISARRKKVFGRGFCEFFRFGYCKKIDATEESFRVYSPNREGEKGENVRFENFDEGSRERERDILESSSSSSSVPNNALILTRCRSAPYRSSSLGGIFWASSVSGKEEEDEQQQQIAEENGEKTEHLQIPNSENEEEKGRISEELSPKKLENSNSESVHPLLLTRCKSEPARFGERLAIFSRETRLDDVQVQQQNS